MLMLLQLALARRDVRGDRDSGVTGGEGEGEDMSISTVLALDTRESQLSRAVLGAETAATMASPPCFSREVQAEEPSRAPPLLWRVSCLLSAVMSAVNISVSGWCRTRPYESSNRADRGALALVTDIDADALRLCCPRGDEKDAKGDSSVPPPPLSLTAVGDAGGDEEDGGGTCRERLGGCGDRSDDSSAAVERMGVSAAVVVVERKGDGEGERCEFFGEVGLEVEE